MVPRHFWRNPRVILSTVLLLVLSLFVLVYFLRSRPATTVILVRHAEKRNETDNPNPSLSAAGIERAKTLMQVLANAGVTHIYATQYLRTQETVKPIADRLGLQVNEVEAHNTAKLAGRVKSDHSGGVVLIAGHSNTLPEIVAAIGGEPPPAIPDNEYDNLFVVTLSSRGESSVLRLKYGNSVTANQ